MPEHPDKRRLDWIQSMKDSWLGLSAYDNDVCPINSFEERGNAKQD